MISRGFDLKPAYTQLKEFDSPSEASAASLGVMQSVSRFHTSASSSLALLSCKARDDSKVMRQVATR
jgi:hypothetical protein